MTLLRLHRDKGEEWLSSPFLPILISIMMNKIDSTTMVTAQAIAATDSDEKEQDPKIGEDRKGVYWYLKPFVWVLTIATAEMYQWCIRQHNDCRLKSILLSMPELCATLMATEPSKMKAKKASTRLLLSWIAYTRNAKMAVIMGNKIKMNSMPLFVDSPSAKMIGNVPITVYK